MLHTCKQTMTHNSNHQAGGILALLASGSMLLAACAAVARPDCGDWTTKGVFEQVAVADVARCLSQGADLEATDSKGRTPLHRAAEYSETPAVVKALLDAGAHLEAKDKDGETPLHRAVLNSTTPEVVKALLDTGADPNARDEIGWSPLPLAALNSTTPEVVKALLDAGAHLEARNKDGSPHCTGGRGPGRSVGFASLADATKITPCSPGRRRGTGRSQPW